MPMKLSDYKKDYDLLTGKASDVARQLSFAGIAIVWIFRLGEGLDTTLSNPLLLSLAMFALSLFCDLLHYVVGSIIWGQFHWRQEKDLDPSLDPDLDAPDWYNWPALVFFYAKLVAVVLGYIVIIRFLASLWWASQPAIAQ